MKKNYLYAEQIISGEKFYFTDFCLDDMSDTPRNLKSYVSFNLGGSYSRYEMLVHKKNLLELNLIDIRPSYWDGKENIFEGVLEFVFKDEVVQIAFNNRQLYSNLNVITELVGKEKGKSIMLALELYK